MKKYLLLFVALLCFVGIRVVNAKTWEQSEMNDIEIIHDGDEICGYDFYTYNVLVMDYEGNELKYIGETTQAAQYRNSERDYCGTFDAAAIFGAVNREVPQTDEFILNKPLHVSGTSYISPYYRPKVELTCDKETLKYGENSNCTLKYTTKLFYSYYLAYFHYDDDNYIQPSCVGHAEFTFNDTNYKLIDYKSDLDVTKNGNDFVINSGDRACSVEEDNVLIEFTITPKSKDISGSLDVVAEGLVLNDTFKTLNLDPAAPMSIAEEAKEEEKVNPKTFGNPSVYIVVIVFCTALLTIVVAAKGKVFKKI